jgi:hypothetical protein
MKPRLTDTKNIRWDGITARLLLLCRNYALLAAIGLPQFQTPALTRSSQNLAHLNPETAWKPNRFRQCFSGVAHEQQWEAIKHLPFERV